MTLPIPAGESDERPSRAPALIQPGMLRPAAITIVAGAALLAVIQLLNMATSYALTDYGIRPRSLSGLWGILSAPLLHKDWTHLAANIVPWVVFGFIVLMRGVRQFLAVTVLVWLVSGIGVWLTAPANTVTIGASGLVFGWLTFLVLRGFFARRISQILVGLVLLAIWGGIFWGILPDRSGVSWQAHLAGAIGGILAALLVAKADAPARTEPAEPAQIRARRGR